MSNRYFDKDHVSAADNPANGSEATPYLTPAYAITQASGGDVLYGAPTTTPYDLGANTALLINKAVTYAKWENGDTGSPEINGGDATRLINLSGVAGTVVIDGFVLESTRVGGSSYIFQAGAATRDLTFSNTRFEGAASLGALTVANGASGVVVDSTCEFDMTSGAAIYNGFTSSLESYAPITLRGAAQAAVFIPNGDCNGASVIIGGEVNLIDVNNYVVRCGATNEDLQLTIHGSFNLAAVPDGYTRTAFDIYNPRSFVMLDGWRVDARNAEGVSAGHVWVRTPVATVTNTGITIGAGTIEHGGIAGYGVKIGDESPNDAHGTNKYSLVTINGVTIRDGKEFGVAGSTNTHVFFIGNEDAYKLSNLHGIQGAYGVGWKGDSTVDADSYTYNCLMEGMRLAHFKTKGGTGTRWINCHALEDSKGGPGFDLTDNTDDGASGTGDAAFIRNCIMEMDTDAGVNIDAASDLNNEDIDYNIYIITGTGNTVTASGVNLDFYTDWQGKGNDLNSYIINSREQIFDSDDNILQHSLAWRTGAAVTGVTPVQDVTGATTITLTGATLSQDTHSGRRLLKAFA